MRLLAILVCCGGCLTNLEDVDGAFYNWDHRAIHCAIDVDADGGYSVADIARGLDRAKARGEVVELLVHAPDYTLPIADFEAIVAAAAERDLPFLTYKDLDGPPRAGVALEHDDWRVSSWLDARTVLAKYNARTTIFVAHYDVLSDEDRAGIRRLADAGDDIEAHSIHHLRGPEFVEDHGLDAYISEEVLPSIQLLRQDGYDVDSYAYPFGTRTDEMDRAILALPGITKVRALAHERMTRANPCPY